MKTKKLFNSWIIWVLVGVVAVVVFLPMAFGNSSAKIDTSQGLAQLSSKNVTEAKMYDGDQRVDLSLRNALTVDGVDKGTTVTFYYSTARAEQVVDAINDANLDKFTDQPVESNWLLSMLGVIIPFLLIAGIFWFILARSQGGGSKVMQFGKSKAKLITKDMPQVTFKDVAGADEAVEELHEIKEFLREPAKFQAVGAKIPKGVLLYGPPGTGKTLLAKAVAGEAQVPFYSISGSDFVEMFVGVGASRVRDLFEQAKNNSPAIIFVDEIDAVGRHRGAGIGGGNDEREQTLNQLLVEMDGFDATTNVILIAATNRPDVLDPALLRPGRFDRQIPVEAPDLKGREDILKVHVKGKPMHESVDLNAVAKKTPGYTGADLANVLNEAALLTARSNANLIDDRALDEAIDRVMAGPQKRTRLMDEHERKVTAYHEGGHALVAAAMNQTAPVTKITILPRGRALGYTMVVPESDKYSVTRNELLDQMAYAMGGRVAEEIVFHDPSTGASNDIEKATATARKMVTEYGMSEKVGAVRLAGSAADQQMGQAAREFSDEMAHLVDEEVRTLIEQAHNDAYWALTTNRHVLDRLALALLERETLNQKEIAEIFSDLVKRDKRDVWLSNEARPVHPEGPVFSPGSARRSRPTRIESVSEVNQIDQPRIAAAVREILEAIGEDPDRDGLQDTPQRVAKAYAEFFAGLHQDPADHLSTTFDIEHDEMVLVKDIPFYSTCEHHLVPFFGTAHIGYIPGKGGKVTGLSKLARLVEVYARRPQVQERLTTQIVDALVEHLKPAGAIVVIECEHMCMSMRGVQKPGAKTVTSAVRGQLRETATRAEAMSLILGR